MTALMIVLGAFALIGICCWVAYDAGRYSAVDELDEYMEVARMLGAYGAALRFESAATGTPVADLMARDQKRGLS